MDDFVFIGQVGQRVPYEQLLGLQPGAQPSTNVYYTTNKTLERSVDANDIEQNLDTDKHRSRAAIPPLDRAARRDKEKVRGFVRMIHHYIILFTS